MRKIYFIILFLLFITPSNSKEVDSKNDNVYYSCKIWGFLKYYHPSVMEGKYDWDKELFRILKDTESVKTKEERNKLFYDWIIGLGEIKHGNDFIIADSSQYKQLIDYSWLKNETELSRELCDLLQNVLKAKKTTKNKYVSFSKYTNVPIFDTENDYANILYTKNYMTLTLCRYWNAIEYFFPYKRLMDDNWDDILRKYIPIFENATDTATYYDAISRIVSKINDSHGHTFTSKGGGCEPMALRRLGIIGDKKVPSYLDYIENQVVVANHYGGSFDIYELEIGDIILEMDDIPIQDKIEQVGGRFSESNHESLKWMMNFCLLTSNSDSVKVKFKREDSIIIRQVKCESLYDYNSKLVNDLRQNSLKLLDNSIAYLDVSNNIDKKELTLLKNRKNSGELKAFIIDIRHGAHEMTYYTLGEIFFNLPKEFVRFSETSIDRPGLFKMNKSTVTKGSMNNKYDGKVIILVDNGTQSFCEYLTMAFQSIDGAMTIGRTTSGADGNITRLDLPGGITTQFSGIGVYYPDGGETQRVGVRIDEIVKPTIKGIREGRDEVLERAIEIINSK